MLSDPKAISEFNWAGIDRSPAQIRTALRRSLRADGMINADDGTLVVELIDGLTPIGYVTWRTEQWGPQEGSRCLAFGIALLPEYRGFGHGTEAQRQLIDFLFTATTVHRVQSDTAVDNHREQAVLRRLGLVEEGRVRGAEYRNGAYHDHLLFSILRPEWEPTRVDELTDELSDDSAARPW